MAKFSGTIGFVATGEQDPGVWDEIVTEKPYFGDVQKHFNRIVSSENLNDNVVSSNTISIVADAYANDNIHHMRFVRWNGIPWLIQSFEVLPPRITLYLGGVYNEP